MSISIAQTAGTMRASYLQQLRAALLVAYQGKSVDALPTPSLVIHADAFDQNKSAMEEIINCLRSRRSAEQTLCIRPHAKLHKSRVLADRILNGPNANLYSGVCVQKISEAEALSGIYDSSDNNSYRVRNILITNGLSTQQSALRAASLHRWMVGQNSQSETATTNPYRLAVCVDSREAVEMLTTVFDKHSIFPLYIEVNVGQDRGGAQPTAAGIRPILDAIAGAEGRFVVEGLHAYHGGAQHIRDPLQREETMKPSVLLAKQAKDVIESYLAANKIQPQITLLAVTGAGSGTFAVAEGLDGSVYNEIQAGSYIVMDRDYLQNNNMRPWLKAHTISTTTSEDDASPLFIPAMYIKSSVVSKSGYEGSSTVPRIVVDSGHKSSAIDSGLPCLAPWQASQLLGQNWPASNFFIECGNGGDDHGVFKGDAINLIPYNAGAQSIKPPDAKDVGKTLIDGLSLGSPVWLVPGHCDPTFNLHDYFFIVGGDSVGTAKVLDIGMVDARGCQQ